jgi:hypothetical protein
VQGLEILAGCGETHRGGLFGDLLLHGDTGAGRELEPAGDWTTASLGTP